MFQVYQDSFDSFDSFDSEGQDLEGERRGDSETPALVAERPTLGHLLRGAFATLRARHTRTSALTNALEIKDGQILAGTSPWPMEWEVPSLRPPCSPHCVV